MENQNTELRQLQNTVEIVGTLKSKDLEVKTSKAGNKYMSGKLVVASKFDGKINEQIVKVFIMASSKLFKGIETVMNEYKTIEKDGKDEADRVRITGELKLNEYYNSQGSLNSYNEIKGVFFNRLDDSNDQPDKAIASIETVVESFVEKLDKDQLPTGEYTINGFTVGWGNEVIELKNTIVKPELAQAFIDLYPAGSTGRLTLKLNNYVEVEETQVEQAPTHGFGTKETIENVVKNFVNNIEVIGGDMPYFGTKEYTPEEIENAKQVRNLALQQMQQPAPSTPQTNTGFGHGSSTSPSMSEKELNDLLPTDLGNSDMPDF